MTEIPTGLGVRGASLWKNLGQVSEHSASGVLAVEACRTADRLEGLHNLLAGGEWLRVEMGREGDVVLMVDKALAEVRLQAAALKSLLESPELKVAETGKADPLDDLAAQREARRANAAGALGS